MATRFASRLRRISKVTCPLCCRWVLFSVLLILVVIAFSFGTPIGYVVAAVLFFTATIVGINNCVTEYQMIDDGGADPAAAARGYGSIGRFRPPSPYPRENSSPVIMTIGDGTSTPSSAECSMYSFGTA